MAGVPKDTSTVMQKASKTKPAGKRPTLRPLLAVQPLIDGHQSPHIPHSAHGRLQGRKSLRKPRQGTTHRMITRSKGRTFRLMDLPPEIRAKIYSHAVSNSTSRNAVPLGGEQLPELLSLSRAVRTEALPVFFATTTFATKLRSNWCVRNKHFHGPGYIHYEEAGGIELPDTLVIGSSTLPKEAVRFRRVDFDIECACCDPGREIASVYLSIERRKPKMMREMKSCQREACAAFGKMFDEVQKVISEIEKREVFNGFTIEDILAVGARFNNKKRNKNDHEDFW